MTDTKTSEPSALAKEIAESVSFCSCVNYSSPAARSELAHALSNAGLADLERQLAEAQKDLRDKFGDQMPDRVNGLRREVADLELQLTEAQAENERIREAARPFVEHIEKLEFGTFLSAYLPPARTGRAPACMTYEQFDNLRAALATQPGEEEGK
jgi:hypothetical protein